MGGKFSRNLCQTKNLIIDNRIGTHRIDKSHKGTYVDEISVVHLLIVLLRIEYQSNVVEFFHIQRKYRKVCKNIS